MHPVYIQYCTVNAGSTVHLVRTKYVHLVPSTYSEVYENKTCKVHSAFNKKEDLVISVEWHIRYIRLQLKVINMAMRLVMTYCLVGYNALPPVLGCVGGEGYGGGRVGVWV